MKQTIVLALLAVLALGCPFGHGSKKIGEKCSDNNDCAEVQCAKGLCTKACKADADCTGAAVKMVCKGNIKTETNTEAYGRCAEP